jgi:excisionase family DNA binding protein
MDASLQLLNVEETALFLKVSEKTIYYWVGRYEIPFIKVGRHLRFNPVEVAQHFTRKTLEQRPSCVAGGSLVRSPNAAGAALRRSLTSGNESLAEPKKGVSYGTY